MTTRPQGITLPSARPYINVQDAPYGAKGDGVTDDTTAIQAADTAAVGLGAALYFPPGIYIHGRLALVNGDRHWFSQSATLRVLAGIYTASSAPALSGVFSNCSVLFEGIVFDQNWLTLTYPSGFSRNDAYKASSWGGGSWYAEFDGNQTARVEFRNCPVINTFRGFLVKSQLYFAVVDCKGIDCSASIGDSIFAAELCIGVAYTGNELVSRNWNDNPGITGANGLFGNTCRNVLIAHNHMRGFQLVFHATEPGAVDVGMGRRCSVLGNIIEVPPADTAFYRWDQLVVSNNLVQQSGDMGIAVSSSSFAVITGNVIKGAHVGGIGVTECKAVIVTDNSITDVAQGYAAIVTLAGRYASNAGAWLSGITCDYQSGGQKGVESVIANNTLSWTTLPPVSDALGNIRAAVNGIYVQSSANTASQSTFSVSGNYVKDDSVNMPAFFVNVPSHRIYISAKTGAPILGEVFANGAVSFVYCADYGAGNLCFFKKLLGTIVAGTVYTGAQSGATLTAHGTPQLTWLKCTGAGNFDRSTDYVNANLAP